MYDDTAAELIRTITGGISFRLTLSTVFRANVITELKLVRSTFAISKDRGPISRILSETFSTPSACKSRARRSKCTKGCVFAIATATSDPRAPFPPVIITVPMSGVAISRAKRIKIVLQAHAWQTKRKKGTQVCRTTPSKQRIRHQKISQPDGLRQCGLDKSRSMIKTREVDRGVGRRVQLPDANSQSG